MRTGERRVTTAISALALVAGIAASAVLLARPRPDRPAVLGILVVGSGWALVAAGLLARARRPANRTGVLLMVTGFLLLASALRNLQDSWPFTVGVVISPLPQAVFVHLLLAFPQGRLHSRAERVLTVIAYLDAALVQVVTLLFADYRAPDHRGAGCPCPTNLLFVRDVPGLHDALTTGQRVAGVGVVIGVVLVLVGRWRTASPPLRRSLAPVLWTGGFTAALTGAAYVLAEVSAPFAVGVDLAGWASMVLVPAGVLVGLLRSRLARAAVGDLVLELGHPMAPGDLRGALAAALGDPSLELAYRIDGGDAFVDLHGHDVELPTGDGDRAVTPVERDGRQIAAVVHDAALTEEPDLVSAACAAAALALENERLQAELRARLDELRASRARIVQAADVERRRLERNLHDGAQQRLVGLAVSVGLAQARLPHDPRGAATLLAAVRAQLGETLEELRELARGIHPTILTDRGLAVALEALAERLPLPVELEVVPGRLPGPVEAAAYYVVVEAVANAAKHAGASSLRVSVGRQDGRLAVVVQDDGVGGADPRSGSGLRGLADRVEALDGRLSVSSPLGAGTRICAELPCG